MEKDSNQSEYYYKAETLEVARELDAADELKLIQFEVNGLESGYQKSIEGFAGVNSKEFTTYSLDPYYSQSSKTSSSNPVFNVTIQNNSDDQVLITDIIYRVHKVGAVKGGDYGPLSPNVKYRHGIDWVVGDQLAKLSPPFSIKAKRAGSFLLEIESLKESAGLAWLLEVVFIDSNNKSVKTNIFQIIMSKNKMKKSLTIYRSISLIAVFFLVSGCTKHLSCEDQGLIQTQVFIDRWNSETERLTIGSWSLPLWQEPKYGETETFRHSLDGPSLLIELHTTGSCLASVDIRAKRDVDIGMASFLSRVKLLKVLVPSATNTERNHFLNSVLGVDKPQLQAGGTGTLGSFEFAFSESIEGNTLQARPIEASNN